MTHAVYTAEATEAETVAESDGLAVAPPADEFDDLVNMAAQLAQVPMATIAVAEGGRLRLAASHGSGAGMIPCDHVLCGAVDAATPILELPDVRADMRFRHDPLVMAVDGLRSYLGIALLDSTGQYLGVLSLADMQPRAAATGELLDNLHRLARIAARLVERRALQRSNHIAGQIAQADFSGVIVVDTDGRVSYANTAASNFFSGRTVLGASVQDLFPPALQLNTEDTLQWLQSGAPGPDRTPQLSHDLRVRHADGSVRIVEAARCAWLEGEERGMALILRDVTARRELRDRARRFSQMDELTGLPHRTMVLSVLDGLLRDHVQPLGVAVLGLDSFRTVNDTLGHTVGDAVLQVVACRLQASLPAHARLARFGGDEFALIYPRAFASEIDAHLRDVMLELGRPCEVDNQLVHIEASVGIAMADKHADSRELVARADLAMQRAKHNGGRQIRHFEPNMRVEAHDRRRLDLELRRACSEGEFELHYQPQVCLTTGVPTGAEALLRWRHPQRGLLAPDQFIDALSMSSVGPAVGRWILERACEDAANWPTVNDRQMSIGVNLFPVQLNVERLPGEVDYALARSGLTAAHLELELTETIALRDDGVAAGALANLRARGIRVAYDDFGTGYASLSVLRRLPVDRVKIDRSFVRDVLANRGDAAIVRSILLIARSFDLRVIAEGVETPAQEQLLRDLGCQEAQGFLYSPALPPREFRRWIHARMDALALRNAPVAGHA